MSCKKNSNSIKGMWIGKHDIQDGQIYKFDFGKEIFNFSEDSLEVTNMLFDKYLNISLEPQIDKYELNDSLIFCSIFNNLIDSAKIYLLSNDSLILGIGSRKICFSKVPQYTQANKLEKLKIDLTSNLSFFNGSKESQEFLENGNIIASNIELTSLQSEWKIFKVDNELFISMSGGSGPLLQIIDFSDNLIKCVNHVFEKDIWTISLKQPSTGYQLEKLIGNWITINENMDSFSIQNLLAIEFKENYQMLNKVVINDNKITLNYENEKIESTWNLSISNKNIVFGRTPRLEMLNYWEIKSLNDSLLTVKTRIGYEEFRTLTFKKEN